MSSDERKIKHSAQTYINDAYTKTGLQIAPASSGGRYANNGLPRTNGRNYSKGSTA